MPVMAVIALLSLIVAVIKTASEISMWLHDHPDVPKEAHAAIAGVHAALAAAQQHVETLQSQVKPPEAP